MKIKRKTLELWKRILIFSTIFASIIGLGTAYFRSPMFSITSYELIGIPELYKESITKNLQSIAETPYLGFIPGNRILSFRTHMGRKAVIDILPNLEKVTITPVGLHTLRVRVVQYEPLFKINETRGITKSGVIYTEFKDLSYLPVISFATSTTYKEQIIDDIHSTSVDGLDSPRLTDLNTLVSKINKVVFTVSKIEAEPNGGDVVLFSQDGNARVIFLWDGNYEKVWSNLVSAIDTEPLKSKLATNKDRLEYLDTRFGNKVFYKFTGDTIGGKFTNGKNTAIIESHEATSTATTTSAH